MPSDGRIARSVAAARGSRGVSLLPFLPAGYPSLDATVACLQALDPIEGVGAVEIGFPFSDPIADGPVIQQAFSHALEQGVKTRDIFDALRPVAPKLRVPLVAMVSYSIIFKYGSDRFVMDAKQAGFSGILVPDLPPPEAQGFCGRVSDAGLDTVLLVAPTTTPARRAEIARLCTGFVYYLSVSGITGERAALPADLTANVRQIKSMTAVPVCVGFGISKPEHVRQLEGVGDGAIVGSAIVRVMQSVTAPTPARLASEVASACRKLLA